MPELKNIVNQLKAKRIYLFHIQIMLSMTAIGFLLWYFVGYIKVHTFGRMDFHFYPWTYPFFRPVESALLNYLSLGFVMGLCGLVFYILQNKKNMDLLREKLTAKRAVLFLVTIAISLYLLDIVFLRPPFSITGGIFAAAFISLTPFALLRIPNQAVAHPAPGKRKIWVPILLSLFILVIIGKEPLGLVRGPIYLMNEFPDLYGDTYIKGQLLNNKEVLDKLKKEDVETLKVFFELRKIFQDPNYDYLQTDGINFLRQFEYINLESAQIFINSLMEEKDLSSISILMQYLKIDYLNSPQEIFDIRAHLRNLRNIDVESIKKLFLANFWEYYHLNIGRGQINHIGHIYNPLNEYELGKPLSQIYMQYGLGNTLLMKWVMDLFGGISIENYYKCFLFYILYSIAFLAMLYILFRNPLYVLGAFSIHAFAFFRTGYVGFILGAGMIPTIHFLDVWVVIFLVLFFQQKNRIYLPIIFLLAGSSVFLNFKFGGFLAVSIFVSITLYISENINGSRKYLWIVVNLFAFIMALYLPSLFLGGTSDNYLKYYLLGYFSWPPKTIIVYFTILYLVASYFFLIFLKNRKLYLKYVYTFVFIYTQCLLLYFYWSGIWNHLPMILPFAGVQIFLMLYIMREIFMNDPKNIITGLRGITIGAVMLAILLIPYHVIEFYTQKKEVLNGLLQHKTYSWELDRARVISTVDPTPIQEAIKLIRKYSQQKDPGIYLISKYDNILPFLAGRYSLMPHFELAYSLFSEDMIEEAADRIKSNQPEYIFADANLEMIRAEQSYDPWSKIFVSKFDRTERISRLNRYLGLQKLFKAVQGRYQKIEEGEMLWVYKQKAEDSPKMK